MEFLKNLRGTVKFNYNLAPLTWLKVGGPTEIFYKPADIEDLKYFLQNLPQEVDVNIIGAGSNILIRDGGISGATIKLGSNFNYINQEDDVLIVGGATLNYNLAQYCLQNSIKGFEFLAGIPGTIGGGIAMNAGAYGSEFKDIISQVVAIKHDGTIIELNNQDLKFKHRGNDLAEQMFFVEARFPFLLGNKDEIKQKIDAINLSRKQTQPITEKTAGSTFVNPPNQKAWQLIDKVGMRGYTLRKAQFSPLHCNFLINLGDAAASDLEELAETARSKVKQELGIELIWEVRRLGKKL